MKRKQIRDAYALVMLTEAEKKRLLQSILSAKDQSLTERKGTMKRWSKKTILIAAVITALVIFMGCAVAALSTQKLKLDEYRETSPAWIDAEGKRHEAAEVTKTVLSLQGIENTPEQMAAKEWYDFRKSYDPNHDIYMASQGKFQAPEEYGAYDVYSQEMVEKLTQIAQKYSLKLSGRKAVAYSYDWKLGLDALGLPDSLVSGAETFDELRGCSFYDSGSFALWMECQVTDPAFTWKRDTHLVLNYKVKGYLDTDVVDLVSGANTRQWNYTRSDGQTILVVVALDPDQPANDRLLLICDREEAFLYARMSPAYYPDGSIGSREEMSDQDINWLAEHIDFSIQPKKPDMDAILPLLQKEDEAYDALLEQDDPFRQDSYDQLRKVLGGVTEFALLDLDGDGTEECFFWDRYQNPQLYTMKDGKTAPVMTDDGFSVQGQLSLCQDKVVKTCEEVGEAYRLYSFYRVEKGSLVVLDRLVYDIANDAWGLSLSGIHIDKKLAKEEAEAILESHTEIPLERLPTGEFPEDK